MPSYSGVWNLPAVMQAVAAGNWQFQERYWITTLGGSGIQQAYSLAADDLGNAYIAGSTDSTGAGGNDVLLAKYDTNGNVQWQRTLGGASSDVAFNVSIDSSGNAYIIGRTNSAGVALIDCLIAKYDADGNLQWQRTLGQNNDDLGLAGIVDASGNVYVGGYSDSTGVTGNYDAYLAKYDTNGTIQWQRVFGGVNADYARGLAVDGSGNLYVTGNTESTGAGGSDFFLAKYDTNGTIQWQRVLGGASTETGRTIALDGVGNVFVVGYTASTGAGGNDALLTKYDTSGNLQWQRILGGASTDVFAGVSTDSLGNVYVTGYTGSTGAGSNDVLLAKYDTSGNIQWQRTLGGAQNDVSQYSTIKVNSSGNMYVGGYTYVTPSGPINFFVAKLPSDGSLTGTYGYWTYAASSLTAATSTLTPATSSLTSNTVSFTSSTSALTSATSALTSTKTDL